MAGPKIIDDTDKIDAKNAPGCGVATYAILLLLICLAGLVGIAFSSWNLLSASRHTDPFSLMSGTDVDPSRLEPLREAGLLGPQEVPMAFHDESPDMSGTTACAMTASAMLRVEPGQARRLSFDDMADIQAITGATGDVFLMTSLDGDDQHSLACRFGPNQGGTRFLRQVQVELLTRGRGPKE